MGEQRESEETVMRRLVVSALRNRWPSARILHEPSLRYSSNRLDVAAVTDAAFIAVEIKSSIDKPDRLAAQLEAFLPVCNQLVVALAPKWMAEGAAIAETKPGGWVTYRRGSRTVMREIADRYTTEIWTVDAVSGNVSGQSPVGWRLSQPHPWPRRMLDLLHVGELAAISQQRGWPVGRISHCELADRLAANLTGGEAQSAVRRALRSRQLTAKASDPPIVPVGLVDA